jgi:hypothetical protein
MHTRKQNSHVREKNIFSSQQPTNECWTQDFGACIAFGVCQATNLYFSHEHEKKLLMHTKNKNSHAPEKNISSSQ